MRNNIDRKLIARRGFMAGLIAVALTATTVAPLWAAPPLGPKALQKGPGRFKVLVEYQNAAALDKQTGLVWELKLAPEERVPWLWSAAIEDCFMRKIGGRYGWRLPTVTELATLVDDSQPDGLPVDHPFELDTTLDYWTQTSVPNNAFRAYTVWFSADAGIDTGFKGNYQNSICVRAFGGSEFYENYLE